MSKDIPAPSERSFNIVELSAEEALIEFARQSSLTIIFPFEKTRAIRANPLQGNYTVEQGLHLLLMGTGLQAEFNNKGSVSISLTQANGAQNDGLLSVLKQLFVEEGDRLQTTPAPQTPSIEIIEVTGIRAGARRAMDVKYHEQGVIDTIQSEEIGKFPDLNLAESLQRVTGVSIDRSEGEGQFVTVRGFGPEFNAVLVNGRKMPTDNLGREFSFDTFSSDMVSGVTVQKTASASQITGGIGAVIDIQTARPFDMRGFKVAGQVNTLYDTNSQTSRPQAAMLVSHSNNTFGWLVSLSQQKRRARIDEAQIDGWLLNTNVPQDELTSRAENLFVPRNYDQRVRFDSRTRTNGTLVLQYKPNEDIQVTADYLTTSFDVKTDSTSMGHWFTSSNLEDVVTDVNGTAISFAQNVGHATDFHARTFNRPSKLNAIGLNITWQASNSLSLETDMSLSGSAIDDTGGSANALTLIGYLNRSRFFHGADTTLPQISGFESADPTIVNADGIAAGVENYLDPANGRAHVMLRRGWKIDDDIAQFRLQGAWRDDAEKIPFDVHFGLFYMQQTKTNDRWDNEANAVHCFYCGYFDQPDIPDSFQQVFNAGEDFLSGISGSHHIPRVWLRHNGDALVNYLQRLDNVNFAPVLRESSFAVREDTWSLFSELHHATTFNGIDINTQVGLRYEQTNIDIRGFDTELLGLDILDQTELAPVIGPAIPSRDLAMDRHWLPSIQSQWYLNEAWVLRLGYSHTLTRPTLTQVSPSLVFNTTRQGGDLRASQGNPALRPFKSSNLDVSLEWYSQAQSFASVAYFRKSVENFIVSNLIQTPLNDVFDPSTGSDPLRADAEDAIALFDITRPINGETAIVEGIEVAYQHHFASGLGFLVNATMIDSNAELDRTNVSQKFALTGLSDTQNIIMFYDNDLFQARLVWNRRSGFLQSLTQRQSGEPTFVEDYRQVDVSASYALSDEVRVFVEGINVTEASVLKHGRYDNQLLLAQSPGARYVVGVRGSF